jgi:hypothetical protein
MARVDSDGQQRQKEKGKTTRYLVLPFVSKPKAQGFAKRLKVLIS